MTRPIPKPVITGVVDLLQNGLSPTNTVNFPTLFYPRSFLEGKTAEEVSAVLRESFTHPERMYLDAKAQNKYQLVLRPFWNSDKSIYLELDPEDAKRLSVGMVITARVAWNNGNIRRGWTNWGRVSRIMNRLPDAWKKPANWFDRSALTMLDIGEPLFEGREFDILVNSHTAMGEGEISSIVATPQSGKTTFIKSLTRQAKPRVIKVYILDERSIEINDFLRFECERHGLDFDTVVAGGDFLVIGNTYFFCSPQEDDGIVRIHNSEIGLLCAVRLAEQGTVDNPVQVVVFWDSVSKGLTNPLDDLPGPEGVGSKSGGGSGMTKDAVAKAMNIARRFREGSITVIGTHLVEPTPLSANRITEALGSGTQNIQLSLKLGERGVWPAIDYNLSEVKSSMGGSFSLKTTNARRPDKWMEAPHYPQNFAKGTERLQMTFSSHWAMERVKAKYLGTGVSAEKEREWHENGKRDSDGRQNGRNNGGGRGGGRPPQLPHTSILEEEARAITIERQKLFYEYCRAGMDRYAIFANLDCPLEKPPSDLPVVTEAEMGGDPADSPAPTAANASAPPVTVATAPAEQPATTVPASKPAAVVCDTVRMTEADVLAAVANAAPASAPPQPMEASVVDQLNDLTAQDDGTLGDIEAQMHEFMAGGAGEDPFAEPPEAVAVIEPEQPVDLLEFLLGQNGLVAEGAVIIGEVVDTAPPAPEPVYAIVKWMPPPPPPPPPFTVGRWLRTTALPTLKGLAVKAITSFSEDPFAR